jgi:hypothetical protein
MLQDVTQQRNQRQGKGVPFLIDLYSYSLVTTIIYLTGRYMYR